MATLKRTFPTVKFYILGPIVRQNWYPIIRNMVPRLNLHMKLYHRVRVIQINGFIAAQHLCDDEIHLSGEGYRLFISKGLGPLLDHFYTSIKSNIDEIPVSEMTKSQRRWHYKKLSVAKKQMAKLTQVV